MGTAYGLGSVTQRKDGRWTWRSPPRRDGKRKTLYEKSERAAWSAGRRWLLSDEGKAWMAAKAAPRPTADRTLAEVVNAFLAAPTAEQRIRPATRAQYASVLRTHAVPVVGQNRSSGNLEGLAQACPVSQPDDKKSQDGRSWWCDRGFSFRLLRLAAPVG